VTGSEKGSVGCSPSMITGTVLPDGEQFACGSNLD
jgi:hypothetical protein